MRKLIFMFAILLIIPLASAFNFFGLFGFDSDPINLIGFYYNDTSKQTHVWNNGSVKQDYYYSGECNAQISNLPDEQWEIVTLGLTYGNDSEDLIDNYVELHNGGCNRIELTDNETYVNITVWKQITYLGKTGILAKNSYIELNDNSMKETFYFKSNDNINTNVWFILKRSDINISTNSKDDYVKVWNVDNTTSYLNLSYADENNLTLIKNQDEIKPTIMITDYETEEFIFFYTNTTTDFKFIYNNKNIFNVFKAGTFTIGQSKTLETEWIDAKDCACIGVLSNPQIIMTGPPSEVVVGTNYSVGLKMFYGRGFCANDFMYWEDNSSSSYTTIPAVDTDLDCHGAVCSAPASTSYVYQTLDWEGVGFYGLQGKWVCVNGWATQYTLGKTVNVIADQCWYDLVFGGWGIPSSCGTILKKLVLDS